MFTSPRDAYDSAGKTSLSSRELEAAALFKAARMLEACQQGWDGGGGAERLDAALRHNQRLWSVFQCELDAPGCVLPPGIRLNLILLGRFVDRKSLEVRANPDPAKLQVLVDVNRAIGAGLASPAGHPDSR
jgi:flagellar protein FlaF